MNTLKSIGAVLAGIMVIVVLSTGTDVLLEKLGVFPNAEEGLFITWMLVLAFFYRCVYAVVGGYVTAVFAPNRPLRHGIILGIIGTVVSVFGVIAGWDLSQHWYPIALVITALPCTWLGARLKNNKSLN